MACPDYVTSGAPRFRGDSKAQLKKGVPRGSVAAEWGQGQCGAVAHVSGMQGQL